MSTNKTITQSYACLPDRFQSLQPHQLTYGQAQALIAELESGAYPSWLRVPLLALAYRKAEEHVFISWGEYVSRARAYLGAFGLSQVTEDDLFDGWCNEWHWSTFLDKRLAVGCAA